MLAFRSLDPFCALREPDRRRRDEERLSRVEQRTAYKPKTRLDRKSPIQVRIRLPPAESRLQTRVLPRRVRGVLSAAGTSGLAASNCATKSSTPPGRRGRSNTPRSSFDDLVGAGETTYETALPKFGHGIALEYRRASPVASSPAARTWVRPLGKMKPLAERRLSLARAPQ